MKLHDIITNLKGNVCWYEQTPKKDQTMRYRFQPEGCGEYCAYTIFDSVTGRYLTGEEVCKALNNVESISDIPDENTPIDTPVFAKGRKTWFPRYWAGIEDGVMFCWNDGCTSWTSKGRKSAWEEVRIKQ